MQRSMDPALPCPPVGTASGAVTSTVLRPFAWVSPQHPFHRPLARLADAVEADEGAQALLRRARQTGQALQVHAEVKAGRLSSGLWMPARCYWSLQLRDAEAAFGLLARTMTWDGTQAGQMAQWADLPVDARLQQAGGWFEQHRLLGQARVLRYVPLRRLTFAWQASSQVDTVPGGLQIGKFKRPSRHAQAHRLIDRVAALVAANRPGFRVADARAAEPAMGLYFQTALPGDDLADWLAPAADRPGSPTLRDLPVSRAVLAQVGRMHARLHALPVGNATGWARNDPSQQFETARTQLDWIGLMQPQHRDAVRTLSTRLHRLPTWQEDEARFCHGDLVCSQFLVQGLTGRGHQGGQAGAPASAGPVSTDPADWAITDFDLCHVGDPCRDLAILLASLAYDLPGMAELDRREPARVAHWVAEVSQAYLQAYAEESGAALPADRLVWQGLCAEIHYLALMLKKDRFQPLAFERRLQHALALCGARNWA